MASRNDIFWCRVFFKAFIKHFRKMSDEEIVKDIRQSMDDLEDLVGDTDTFGSQMVRWANGRADEPFATAARENGKKGGRPRKDKESTAGAPTREDGESKSGSGNAGNLGSATPATISQDASTRKDEDDSKAPTSCTVSPKEPVVLNLAYSGEFDNVRLTQEQYNDLLQHVGNMNDCKALIDDFSASIADGSTKSDNHFATLKKWAKARKRFDAEKKEGVPTFQEREGKRQSEQLRKYGLLK